MTQPDAPTPEEPEPIDITPVADGGVPVAVKRRKPPLILAGALALALVVSLGVFVGYQMLFGGPAPAERLPGSALAYLSVDLQSGLDQTRKLMKLAEKFPQGGKSADPKKAMEEFLGSLKLDGLDPKQDLASWLGLRAGAAAWMHSNNEVYGIIAVQSTDDAAAVKGLTRIKDKSKNKVGFLVRDGFALVAIGEKDAQSAADAAAAEASTAPLSKVAKFADARAWLEDDQVAVAYVDLSGIGRVMRTMAESEARSSPELKEMMDEQAKAYQGQAIIGVRAEDDGIVARYHTFGGVSTTAAATDALAKLGALSSGAEIAAVAQIPEELATSAGLFGSLFMPLGIAASPALEPGGSPASPGGDLTAAEQEELRSLMAKENPTPAEAARIGELFRKSSSIGIGAEPTDALSEAERKDWEALTIKSATGSLSAAERKRLDELENKMFGQPLEPIDGPGTGRGDISSLFKLLSGATIQVAVSGVDGKNPAVQITAQLLKPATDADISNLTKLAEGELTIESKGSTVTAVTKGFPSGGGKLADDTLFQRAFAGAPAQLQLAVFVNLEKVLATKTKADFGPVRAISIAQGQDGGQIRVLIG